MTSTLHWFCKHEKYELCRLMYFPSDFIRPIIYSMCFELFESTHFLLDRSHGAIGGSDPELVCEVVKQKDPEFAGL